MSRFYQDNEESASIERVKSTGLDDEIAFDRALGSNHRQHGNAGHGNAVSLPQNNPDRSMKNVTIAQLIVGTRHCRVLMLRLYP